MTREWLRKDFSHLLPYDPAFIQCDVMLSANENTAGIPERVKKEMLQALTEVEFNRYPDPMANTLRDELALWHNVSREHIIVGNGGDELLFNLLLALGGPNATLVSCPPEFSIYALYASMTQMRHVEIFRRSDFSLDEQALFDAAKDATVIFLTSPNNPTGNVVNPEWVKKLAQATDALIVVDEAYIEFSNKDMSCVPLLKTCDNVAILRTFSKAFGMAGIRCGYMLAPAGVVSALSAVRQPYSVDAISQAIATQAVKSRALFDSCISEIVSQRDFVWPSQANFILVRIHNAHHVYERLRDEYSILVRDFSTTPDLENCLRITIGTQDENEKVISALKQIVSEY